MKIILPLLGFGRAGGYRVISRLADELVMCGCEVNFIVPERISSPYYPTIANIIKTKSPLAKNKYWRFILLVYYLVLEIKKTNADVIVATQHLTTYVALFAKKRIKKVYYVQANEVKLVNGYFRKFLAVITYLFPFQKIVNSDEILPPAIWDKKYVVPAGIDLSLFQPPVKNREFSCKNRMVVGFVGRKEKYKGSAEIIESIVRFEKIYSGDICVHVAVYRPDELARLSSKVVFHSIENDHQLADFYRSCDVLIAAGLIESGAFHYPCAEAMASGCLTISNYAPLKHVKSRFYMEQFSVSGVVELLVRVSQMHADEIAEEIENNASYIKSYGWELIGLKMFNALLEVSGEKKDTVC